MVDNVATTYQIQPMLWLHCQTIHNIQITPLVIISTHCLCGVLLHAKITIIVASQADFVYQ